MGWWKVSSGEVITSKRGGQGDPEAPAEAAAMIDVTGPKPPFDFDLNCMAPFPKADVRPAAQQTIGRNGSYAPAEVFGQIETVVVAAFRRHVK